MSSHRYYILLTFDRRQTADKALADLEKSPPAGACQITDYNPRKRCQRIRTNTLERRHVTHARLGRALVRSFTKTQLVVDPMRRWAEEQCLRRVAKWTSHEQLYQAFLRYCRAQVIQLPVPVSKMKFSRDIPALLPKKIERSSRLVDGVLQTGWLFLVVREPKPCS